MSRVHGPRLTEEAASGAALELSAGAEAACRKK
jgi:hypothetical protein